MPPPPPIGPVPGTRPAGAQGYYRVQRHLRSDPRAKRRNRRRKGEATLHRRRGGLTEFHAHPHVASGAHAHASRVRRQVAFGLAGAGASQLVHIRPLYGLHQPLPGGALRPVVGRRNRLANAVTGFSAGAVVGMASAERRHPSSLTPRRVRKAERKTGVG